LSSPIFGPMALGSFTRGALAELSADDLTAQVQLTRHQD
jgi:hypothetical protein